MSTLTIICPNARRVQVKTTPMMLMRQVLEEACLKSGFELNAHRLQTQSRKPVDASLPFRLTGLANNATLEMTIKEGGQSSANTLIDLAIQTASGARHQKKVGLEAPLLEILGGFSAEFGEDLTAIVDDTVPCLIYMNKRYTGASELSANSLASLGVSNGKCLIRHMRVKMSQEQLAEIEAKQKEETLKKKALDANFEKLRAENLERERLEKQRQEAFDKEREAREEREKEHLRAILPEESVEMDTSEIQQPQRRDVLQEVPVQNPNSWSFDGPAFSRQAPQNTMRLEELNRLLERVDNSLTTSSNASESRMDAMVNALADGGRMSLSTVKARADEAMEQEEKTHVEVFADPCPRQACLFKKSARVQVEEPMETEEFYEVGVEDIRNMQKDLRKAVRDQTQAGFVSKAYISKKNRQLKMEAYGNTVIRINIGDHILQACFRSTEQSSNLDDFLKSVLVRSDWKLLFTNQKVATSEGKNFVDIELAPKSTLTLSFGGQAVNVTAVTKDVMSVQQEVADLLSEEWLKPNRPFIPFNSITNEDRKQKRPTIASSVSPNMGQPPAKSAMPKWMGNKK